MVFNLSGYQSVNLLKAAEGYADIYLPDFKYADRDLAKKFSRAPGLSGCGPGRPL